MSEPINLSFWDIERIQREQDKHVTAYSISPIDKKKIFEYIDKEASACDTLKNMIDTIARKVTEQTDMYYICEIAKLYIESQRPAEWIAQDEFGACFKCSNCGIGIDNDFPIYRSYCPNCGRRMKNG